MMKKALIVDDDAKLRTLLAKYLKGYGFEIATSADGSAALETIRLETPDIVILDIMLGKENGLDILKDIRRKSAIPVIMLTAKGEETDRIVGLELGADDYLAKPFNPRELLARMNSVLRRSATITKASEPENKSRLTAGELTLNEDRRSLLAGQTEIPLSQTELRIMKALMSRPNTVFSRDELMTKARGKDFMAFDRGIDVHISNLRAKIGSVSPKMKKLIKTVWGSGYMLETKE